MTNLTLSSILAVAALVVAAAGIVAAAPETGPVTVSINSLGGLELVPVGQSPLDHSIVASGAERAL